MGFPRLCVARLSFPYDGKKENIAQEQGKRAQTACWTSVRPVVNTAVVAVGGDLTQNGKGTARAHRWLDLLDTGYLTRWSRHHRDSRTQGGGF